MTPLLCACAQWWSPWRRKNVGNGHLAPSNLTFFIKAGPFKFFVSRQRPHWFLKNPRKQNKPAYIACSPKSRLQLALAPARGLRAWACSASFAALHGQPQIMRRHSVHTRLHCTLANEPELDLINLVPCELVVWQNRSKAGTRFGFLASCAVSACHLLLSRSSSHARDGGKCSNLRKRARWQAKLWWVSESWLVRRPTWIGISCLFWTGRTSIGRWRAWGRHPRKELEGPSVALLTTLGSCRGLMFHGKLPDSRSTCRPTCLSRRHVVILDGSWRSSSSNLAAKKLKEKRLNPKMRSLNWWGRLPLRLPRSSSAQERMSRWLEALQRADTQFQERWARIFNRELLGWNKRERVCRRSCHSSLPPAYSGAHREDGGPWHQASSAVDQVDGRRCDVQWPQGPQTWCGSIDQGERHSMARPALSSPPVPLAQ